VGDHVPNEQVIAEIMDPNILREEGADGQAQQVKAFLVLALACILRKGEERPHMINVAKEVVHMTFFLMQNMTDYLESHLVSLFYCLLFFKLENELIYTVHHVKHQQKTEPETYLYDVFIGKH
jgi:hypothetical protein